MRERKVLLSRPDDDDLREISSGLNSFRRERAARSEGDEWENEELFHGYFRFLVLGPPKMARKADAAARATMTPLSTEMSDAVITPIDATRAPATVEDGASQIFRNKFFMTSGH